MGYDVCMDCRDCMHEMLLLLMDYICTQNSEHCSFAARPRSPDEATRRRSRIQVIIINFIIVVSADECG